MKTFVFYTYLAGNVISTIPLKMKLNRIKKNGSTEELDTFVDINVSEWSRRVLKKCKIKVTVIGNENLPEDSCLFVANHQSNFDFFAMMGFINKPIGFVAKKELEKFPIFSDWMKEMHCVFMDRSNVRASVKSIEEGVEYLKKGYSMVIFPEGHRSKQHEMKEFKKGSLKLATKAKVPIVPVAIEGGYKIYEGNGSKEVVPGEIKIIIDKPILTEGITKEEEKGLTEKVQSIIKDNLDKMNPEL